MKLDGYYSSGEFARMAKVSIRTIRFYDKQNILKPSYVTPSGARFYTDSDFAKLQQILLFKYLGFSLDDIKTLTIDDIDSQHLYNTLSLQKRLVEDRIEQMQLVTNAISNTISALEKNSNVDWNQMLELIHLTTMEKSYKSQYQNANNIATRIRLHKNYSINPQGWFPWIYESGLLPYLNTTTSNIHILEIGCGDGSLWLENIHHLPSNVYITVSDISEGMIRDVRRNLGANLSNFTFETFDCHHIPYPAYTFDFVIANHLLFYCDDIHQVCSEVHRVLKSNGFFLCSTYGFYHMKEITSLVQEFDSRIVLAAENLYERFGLENGKQILEQHFSSIDTVLYEDAIEINEAQPLIEYILSCHGNQNQYLLERYHDFRLFVEKKVQKKYRITKDAGFFLCSNL